MRALVLIVCALAACDYDASAPAFDAGEDDAALDASAVDAADPDAPDPDAAIDALIDAPIDAPLCIDKARRCEGNRVTVCVSGAWVPGSTCTNLCALGGCVTPPSCSASTSTCGLGGNESCCATRPIPAGSFSRSFDGVTVGATDDRYRATVSGFSLDVYEVTAARFQAFVNGYPAAIPAAGAGRNPHDGLDPGWSSAWAAMMPTSSAQLASTLLCDGLTAQAATDPVRCVTWYLAQAFCVWDGGRLPTEAEWNYAAAGGDQQRVYPWSSPASSMTVSAGHATYGGSAPTRPGAHGLDVSRWGPVDLAGNVWELVYDYAASPYPSMACVDCANHSAAVGRSTRGGSFVNGVSTLTASYRSSIGPASSNKFTGFRCARNPAP